VTVVLVSSRSGARFLLVCVEHLPALPASGMKSVVVMTQEGLFRSKVTANDYKSPPQELRNSGSGNRWAA